MIADTDRRGRLRMKAATNFMATVPDVIKAAAATNSLKTEPVAWMIECGLDKSRSVKTLHEEKNAKEALLDAIDGLRDVPPPPPQRGQQIAPSLPSLSMAPRSGTPKNVPSEKGELMVSHRAFVRLFTTDSPNRISANLGATQKWWSTPIVDPKCRGIGGGTTLSPTAMPPTTSASTLPDGRSESAATAIEALTAASPRAMLTLIPTAASPVDAGANALSRNATHDASLSELPVDKADEGCSKPATTLAEFLAKGPPKRTVAPVVDVSDKSPSDRSRSSKLPAWEAADHRSATRGPSLQRFAETQSLEGARTPQRLRRPSQH